MFGCRMYIYAVSAVLRDGNSSWYCASVDEQASAGRSVVHYAAETGYLRGSLDLATFFHACRDHRDRVAAKTMAFILYLNRIGCTE